MIKQRFLSPFVLAAAVLAGPARAAEPAQAGSLSIAAAANLVYALDALDTEFSRSAPDIKVTTVTGASGNLVAQIKNGAPFDVFLSADLDFPKALIAGGQAEEATMTTFAVGRLVLWTTRKDLDVSDIAAVIRSPQVHKVAIANAATAPYGRAAKEAMEHIGVWADAQPKLVVGENISQTAQFVETGNADSGFVAMSLVLSPKLKERGTWKEVPSELYGSLEQGAVITSHGAKNAAAQEYLAFLGGPAARAILEKYGYGFPASK